MNESTANEDAKMNIGVILEKLESIKTKAEETRIEAKETRKETREGLASLELKVDNNFASKERLKSVEDRVLKIEEVFEKNKADVVKAITDINTRLTQITTYGVIAQLILLPIIFMVINRFFS